MFENIRLIIFKIYALAAESGKILVVYSQRSHIFKHLNNLFVLISFRLFPRFWNQLWNRTPRYLNI